jgi:hypothetical protein
MGISVAMFLESTNVPGNFRKRFLGMGGLVRDVDPYVGLRGREKVAAEFHSAAAKKLENNVVEEVVAKRKCRLHK